MDEFWAHSGALKAAMLAIGLAPSALLAVLGYIFRERLKHTLAKALNAHTEDVKLRAQQDIEAYKVTLIAAIERQKAEAELKKSLAIKHATLEYEALVELHSCLSEVPSSILSRAATIPGGQLDETTRLSEYRLILVQWERLKTAADRAHLFISHNRSIELLELCRDLRQVTYDYLALPSLALPEAVGNGFNEPIASLRSAIRARVEELVSMAGAPAS